MALCQLALHLGRKMLKKLQTLEESSSFPRIFKSSRKSFSFPKGLWLFCGIGFHANLMAHDGTTLSKGKVKCTAKMRLAKYDAKR